MPVYDQIIDTLLDIAIYYQDDHMIMVSKPADLLTVPGRGPD